MDQDMDAVLDNLRNPLDLVEVKQNPTIQSSNSLVIKEMPYQVGDNFPLLVSLTRKPVVFLTRDPRLNIASRMAKKEGKPRDATARKPKRLRKQLPSQPSVRAAVDMALHDILGKGAFKFNDS